MERSDAGERKKERRGERTRIEGIAKIYVEGKGEGEARKKVRGGETLRWKERVVEGKEEE